MKDGIYRHYKAESGSAYELAALWYNERARVAYAERKAICDRYNTESYICSGGRFVGVGLSQEDAQKFPELFNRKTDGAGVFSPDPRKKGGKELRLDWEKANFPDRFAVSRKINELGGESEALELVVNGNWYRGGAEIISGTVVWGVPVEKGQEPPVIAGLSLMKESEYHAMKEQASSSEVQHG